MNYIVFFLFLVLIVADCLTGRRNNQLTVILNILAVAVILILPSLIPKQLAPYSITIVLVGEYLCLRLMIAKYSFLQRESSNTLGTKGAGTLIGYAIIYNIVTFILVGFGIFMIIVALGLAGGFFTVWVGVPSILIAIMALLSGDLTEFLAILGAGAAIGGVGFLIVLAFLLLVGIFSFLFLAVPSVLGIRALNNCFHELRLSKKQIVGYVFFLLIPYFNSIPLIKLRNKCRRYDMIHNSLSGHN